MRINIDEKWKTDPRRTALANRIGGRSADGLLVEITWVMLAHRGKPIPLKEFQYIENYQDWIDCGLAEVVGDRVRVSGADQYREFFDKQKENAKKGGLAKAANRKPNLPKPAQTEPGCPSSSSSLSFSSSLRNHHQGVPGKTASGGEIQDAAFQTEDLSKIEAILEAAYGRKLDKPKKRWLPRILAHFGEPKALASWAEVLVNNENCPDPEKDAPGFERYFNVSLRNILAGEL